jgi:hypothetical protein
VNTALTYVASCSPLLPRPRAKRIRSRKPPVPSWSFATHSCSLSRSPAPPRHALT